MCGIYIHQAFNRHSQLEGSIHTFIVFYDSCARSCVLCRFGVWRTYSIYTFLPCIVRIYENISSFSPFRMLISSSYFSFLFSFFALNTSIRCAHSEPMIAVIILSHLLYSALSILHFTSKMHVLCRAIQVVVAFPFRHLFRSANILHITHESSIDRQKSVQEQANCALYRNGNKSVENHGNGYWNQSTKMIAPQNV